MKLHEHRPARMHLVNRYGGGEIHINEQRLRAPCIVAPDFLLADWISGVDDLSAASLQPLWALSPRIVLLGTVARGMEPASLLRAQCLQHQAGLETMDLGAACRTYNVLAQEQRPVAALLFP